MDRKEDAEPQEDKPGSPILALQQCSGEASRVAGEALYSVHSCSSGSPGVSSRAYVHRHSQSEILAAGFRRNSSFQKLKAHLQKAWRWGERSHEECFPSNFNPEVLANQKRQWYQLHSKTMDRGNYKEPTSLFEHLVIVGLHPDANLEVVEDAFARRKKREKEMGKSESVDFKLVELQGSPVPALEPQILFKYPPGKRLAMRMKDLASFCFPSGVKAKLLERTPSLSELNKLVYGQEHLGRDDLSFIFSLKAADNATLYGICLHVPEIVQRPPGILGISSPLYFSSGVCSRFLVSAARCYCLLTRVPFFELHYEMLNSLIAQERLSRITQFLNEMTLTGSIPSAPKLDDQMSGNDNSPERESFSDWMACAIPLDSAAAITAAAAGIISDNEIPYFSPKISDPQSPSSDASDLSQLKEIDRDGRKNLQNHGDCVFEAMESLPDAFERMDVNSESGHASPDVRYGHGSPEVEPPFSAQSLILERIGSSESLFSPVRSMASEDEDDLFPNDEREYGDELLMEWARENKNELLQIVCGYHALTLPTRGNELVFQPLEHLQAIEYRRPSVAALGFQENCLNCFELFQVNSRLAAAEEALALSVWTIATTCRVLSLKSVLAVVAAVLLEKQVIVVCPNLGVLSAAILSIVPMIRPFQWQSLLLPVLPNCMLDFLDAPVPYIIGVQHKPADLKIKNSSLVHVDVPKDQVILCNLPKLPNHRELVSQLGPIHAKLSSASEVAKRHPVYSCSEAQAEAANEFLNVMSNYLESLCSDLRSHTITSVQSNSDRVSLLLKDSFIDSFPCRDQPFVKLFVDTQMFTVLTDSHLSSLENSYSSVQTN